MLTLYLAAFLAAAGLIVLTQVLGHGKEGQGHDVEHGDGAGHGDGVDHGDGAGHGDDADLDAGHHGVLGSVGQVLPLASLSFWTYFLGAFGLTGLLLTWLGTGLGAGVAPVSLGVGYVAGVFAVQVLRRLRRSETGSPVNARELVGSIATVLLPVGRGQAGKVRVHVKGRLVDLIAAADEEPPLAPGRTVVVHEVQDDGVVRVVAGDDVAPEKDRVSLDRGRQGAATWKS